MTVSDPQWLLGFAAAGERFAQFVRNALGAAQEKGRERMRATTRRLLTVALLAACADEGRTRPVGTGGAGSGGAGGSSAEPPAGRLFVASQQDGTVQVLDARTLDELHTITLAEPGGSGSIGFGAHFVTPNADCSKLYVVGNASDRANEEELVEVETAGYGISRRIKMGAATVMGEIVAARGKVYATFAFAEEVRVFDPGSGAVKVIPGVTTQSSPHGMGKTPDDRYVVASGGVSDGYVYRIDTATDTISASCQVRGIPSEVWITSDGARALLSETVDGRAEILSFEGCKTTAIPLDHSMPNPLQVQLGADDRRAFVAEKGRESATPADVGTFVYVIDLAGARVVDKVATPLRGVYALELAPGEGWLFATGFFSHQVAAVELRAGGATRVHATGRNPAGVAFCPAP